MKISKTLLASTGALAAVVAAAPALAASGTSDWVKPMADAATGFSLDFKTLAAPLIGLCIAIFGLWGCMSGRIDWSRIWLFIIGGALIGGGPTLGEAIMSWW